MIKINTPRNWMLAVILFSAQATNAQVKRTVLEDDPAKARNLRLDLYPLYMATQGNGEISAAARLYYRWQNKFAVSAEFRKEYTDEEENILSSPGSKSSPNHGSLYKGFTYEIAGTYFFKKTEKEYQEYLPLKSRRVSYSTVEVTVDPVPSYKLNLYGVRGGYSVTKGTNTISASTLSNVSNASDILTGVHPVALRTTNSVFGGLSYTRLKNVKVDYAGYGSRRRQFQKEYYLDAMLVSGSSYENVIAVENDVTTTYKIDSTDPMSKLGLRLGYLSSKSGRLVNFSWGAEILLPANMPKLGEDAGFILRIGLSLAGKVGVEK